MIKNILKLNALQNEDLDSINIKKLNFDITLFYEENKNVNEEELKNIVKKIKESIKRKEGLLTNSNFTNKAPKELIEKEKKELQKLQEELKNLETEK